MYEKAHVVAYCQCVYAKYMPKFNFLWIEWKLVQPHVVSYLLWC